MGSYDRRDAKYFVGIAGAPLCGLWRKQGRPRKEGVRPSRGGHSPAKRQRSPGGTPAGRRARDAEERTAKPESVLGGERQRAGRASAAEGGSRRAGQRKR